MIPLGDASRRPTHFPIVTALIIAANAVMFLVELVGGDAFINRWPRAMLGLVRSGPILKPVVLQQVGLANHAPLTKLPNKC